MTIFHLCFCHWGTFKGLFFWLAVASLCRERKETHFYLAAPCTLCTLRCSSVPDRLPLATYLLVWETAKWSDYTSHPENNRHIPSPPSWKKKYPVSFVRHSPSLRLLPLALGVAPPSSYAVAQVRLHSIFLFYDDDLPVMLLSSIYRHQPRFIFFFLSASICQKLQPQN